ncbi:MAG: response regulator, partial [Ekhidna sp.]|nr:response regulator [Ekhidna sp.]
GQQQPNARFLEGKAVIDLVTDTYGNVWAVSRNELHKYDPSENRLVSFDQEYGEAMAVHYEGSNETLLIGSVKGLFAFNTRNYQIEELPASEALSFRGINAINVDNLGRIWAGSWTGGLHLSSPDWSDFEKISLLPSHLTNSNYETVLDILIEDHNGVVWVSTGYGGVLRISPASSVKYTANTFENDVNLPDNNIQSVIKDSNKALWCGTWGGGIGYSRDERNFVHLLGTRGLKVSSFAEFDQWMLAGTKAGVFVYRVDQPESGPIEQLLKSNKIKEVFLDSQRRIWVGTQQKGLFLLERKNGKFSATQRFAQEGKDKSGLQSNRISKVTEDADGTIWVGTYNGLYSFDEDNIQFVRRDDGLQELFPSVIILSIMSYEDHLWVGVPGGLLQLQIEDDSLNFVRKYNTEDGLKNDYITAVSQDQRSSIWLSTASGIATIPAGGKAVINLTGAQGGVHSMNINSYHNDGEKIYFGSSNGLLTISPLQIDLRVDSSEIVFTSLKVDNLEVRVGDVVNDRVMLSKSISYEDEITLTHRESIMSLQFVSNDFGDRENLKYEYRIAGLNDSWIDNGSNTEISFIGLDAGSYTLELRASKNGVSWGAIKQIRINVSPAPWNSNWAYGIYVLVLIAIVVYISRFFVNRAKLEANLELARMNEVKETELSNAKLKFFTNISHELRTPLTLIMSPISDILNKKSLDSEVRERLNYVDKNAKKLFDLINQLLDFRKADQGQLKLRVAQGNFIKFLQEIFLTFKGYAEAEGVEYGFHTSSDQITLAYDRDKMEVVICNLLSNAFKFLDKNGAVQISVSEDEQNCYISVIDNGKGISEENVAKIFDRFYQIKGTQSSSVIGSGIGLSLSKKIVTLHSGDIEVRSQLGKGTSFIVTLPKGVDHFQPEDMIEGFEDSESIAGYDKGTSTVETGIELADLSIDDGKINILVVDDNLDIRNYLESIFDKEGYNVLKAENGLEGKDLALEQVPDIIISDVMMPEMDGLELCRILKEDLRTSHIPIILLTARTSKVYEIEGLDHGADDYVTKPFDASVIRSRVASQVENRKKVRSYLINKIRFEPNAVHRAVDKEEQFIHDVSAIIEGSIQDTDFSIEALADELCMSQSTLYRKIKSLTGFSIAGFVRSIRLKKSAEILIAEDIKLSAVAYSVGFNDYKYFKKTFTEQFGLSPRDYRQNKLDELQKQLE